MHAGVVHLTSSDDGRTWPDTTGAPLELPATIDTARPLAVGSTDQSRVLHIGAIEVGPAGEVAVPYTVRVQDAGEAFVAIK